MTYQGILNKEVIRIPLIGLIFLIKFFQFFWVPKKLKRLKDTITKATGPLVKIAKPKRIQGIVHEDFLSLANVRQNESKLIPTVEHKRESLTAARLQIITKGDNAKLNAPINAEMLLLVDF